MRLPTTRPYLSVACAAMKCEMAYSLWFFSYSLGAVLEALLLITLWRHVSTSVVQAASSLPPSTELVSYVVLTRIIHQFTYPTGQMAQTVRSGDVITMLTRPIDCQLFYLSYHIGTVVTEIAKIGFPMFMALDWLAGPVRPTGTLGIFQFCLSLALAVIVGFLVNFGTETLAFWTLNLWGIRTAREALIELLSGSLIPLWALPAWSRGVVELLPFGAMVHTPASIFIGSVSGTQAWHALGNQAAWVLILAIATRRLWIRAITRVTVQGG